MTRVFSIRALSAILAATSVLTGAAPVSAQSADAAPNVAVRYADLDVSHVTGAKVLLQRIKTAAIRACGGAPDLREFQRRADFDQCRKSAVASAVARVNAPVLTAMAGRDIESVRVAGR